MLEKGTQADQLGIFELSVAILAIWLKAIAFQAILKTQLD